MVPYADDEEAEDVEYDMDGNPIYRRPRVRVLFYISLNDRQASSLLLFRLLNLFHQLTTQRYTVHTIIVCFQCSSLMYWERHLFN